MPLESILIIFFVNFNFTLYLCADKSESTSDTGAEIAQVVERFTRNEKVAGSSPAFGSKGKTYVFPFFASARLGVTYPPNPLSVKGAFRFAHLVG